MDVLSTREIESQILLKKKGIWVDIARIRYGVDAA